MGPYDVDLLRRAAEQRPRRLVEYWAHVAAFMPVELWPVMQHRMAHYRASAAEWWRCRDDDPSSSRVAAGRGRASRGRSPPATSTTGCRGPRSTGAGTGRRPSKALDYLFIAGELAVAGRNSQFEGSTTCPSGCCPPTCSAAPTPTVEEAARRAGPPGRRARTASATEPCLRDYYRMRSPTTRSRRSRTLVEAGELVPVTIEGWNRPAYLHRDAAAAAPGRRPGPAQPVRPGGVGARRAPRRSSASTTGSRSTCPSRQAGARLLRAAVPARRPARRPGRPQGRPQGRAALLGQGARTPSPARPPRPPTELAAELRAAGRLAGPRRRSSSSRAATWRPAAGARPRRPERRRCVGRRWVEWRRTCRCRASTSPGVRTRACHPRQDPPHRRGQDPPPARGGRQGRSTPSRTTSSR